MPRPEKSKYSGARKRQPERAEESYGKRGVSESEAERRAWAAENTLPGKQPRSHGPRRRGRESRHS